MNNLTTLSPVEVGHALRGFGVNLLVRAVAPSVRFLRAVLLFDVVRESDDYAIVASGQQVFQLHPDHTYTQNPLPSLLPQNTARGAGVELRLFELDPDQAEQRARAAGYTVLQAATDKPHGLRECYLLDVDGYCWVPSRKIP